MGWRVYLRTLSAMSSFWNSWWAFAFMMIPFLLCMTGIAIDTHIACSRHFNVMLDSFQKSRWLHQQTQLWGTTSLKSRALIVSSMSTALIYPQLGIRRGVINADEIRRFPAYLKRRMVIASWLTIVGFTWVMIGVGWMRLMTG